MHREEKYDKNWGHDGPYYKITHIGSIKLPEVIEQDRKNFIDYDTVKKIWKEMEEQCGKENESVSSELSELDQPD